MAAALAFIVSSMPPSEATPTPGVEVANAKVKATGRAAREANGKVAPLVTMFGATWGEETRDTSRQNGQVGVGPIIRVGTRVGV